MKSIVFAIVFLGVLSLISLATEIADYFNQIKKRKRIKKTFGIGTRTESQKVNLGFHNGRRSSKKMNRFSLQALGYLLITANIPLSPVRFILICLTTGLCVSCPVWLIWRNILAGAVLLAMCLILPVIFLFIKKRMIQRQLIQQMPEALGMIVRAIKVGLSVDAALKDAADSMSVPFSTEIKIIYEEIRMGLTFDQALGNFESRYPGLADVKIFCTSFILQRETGGNLTQILEGLSDTIKKRFHFQRQIKTFSAEAKTSAIVIGLLPLLFVLVTYVFNPEYITRLTDNPMGRVILFGAFFLEFIGFIIMRNMARINI